VWVDTRLICCALPCFVWVRSHWSVATLAQARLSRARSHRRALRRSRRKARSGHRAMSRCSPRYHDAVTTVMQGHAITVEVLRDWMPDEHTPSTATSSSRYLAVAVGMHVTLTKHSNGWWFGYQAGHAERAKGWLPDICMSLWVVTKAFAMDPSEEPYHDYLNLKIGDEVVVRDQWREGPWCGWARGTTRSQIGSTTFSTTGLFLLDHAEQRVIVICPATMIFDL